MSSSSSTGSASGSAGRSPPTSSSLTVNRREFFTFLGPSGSGKSTILRMVAGLVAPDARAHHHRRAGRGDGPAVAAQSRHDVPAIRRLPAHERRGERRLWPEGARRPARRGGAAGRRDDRAGRPRRACREERHPSQRRRAAARRACPRAGAVAAHAPSRRAACRRSTRRSAVPCRPSFRGVHKKAGTTFLYVTHDQEEALTMSSRIAVVNDGRVRAMR